MFKTSYKGVCQKMIDVGRICYKIAGRESGRVAVVIDKINDNFVFIDGQVKRKKCNIIHLEPTDKVLKIKKNASHDEVISGLKKLNIEVKETKPKPKKTQEKQKKEAKEEPEKRIKEEKKNVKKESKSKK